MEGSWLAALSPLEFEAPEHHQRCARAVCDPRWKRGNRELFQLPDITFGVLSLALGHSARKHSIVKIGKLHVSEGKVGLSWTSVAPAVLSFRSRSLLLGPTNPPAGWSCSHRKRDSGPKEGSTGDGCALSLCSSFGMHRSYPSYLVTLAFHTVNSFDRRRRHEAQGCPAPPRALLRFCVVPHAPLLSFAILLSAANQ